MNVNSLKLCRVNSIEIKSYEAELCVYSSFISAHGRIIRRQVMMTVLHYCADSEAVDMEESTDRIFADEGDRQLAELRGRMGLPAVWF